MKKQEVLIVTNNPLVKEKIEGNYNIDFVDGGILDVMEKLRDMIHTGSVLLTHPLSGSIKPGQTPYKSVMIHIVKGNVDADSLLMIEDAIANYKSEITGDAASGFTVTNTCVDEPKSNIPSDKSYDKKIVKRHNPKTGDMTNIMLYCTVLLAAVLGLLVALIKKHNR